MTVKDVMSIMDPETMVRVKNKNAVCKESELFSMKAGSWKCLASTVLGLEVDHINPALDAGRDRFDSAIVLLTSGTAVVTTQEELQNAALDDNIYKIRLDADISAGDESFAVIFRDAGAKWLDLNDHSINGSDARDDVTAGAIVVQGNTTLRIGGTGTIYGGSGACENHAIYALNGAEVTIYGGCYDTGLSADGGAAETVFAVDNVNVTVIGGSFLNSGARSLEESGHVLGIETGGGSRITCYGGYFWDQNPADGDPNDKTTGATFLGTDCKISVVEIGDHTLYEVKKA